jgi:hypothetical protein
MRMHAGPRATPTGVLVDVLGYVLARKEPPP